MRGGAEHRNKNRWEEELNIEIRTNERRSLFRCSAPPLFCSYFDVELLLSFALISMFSSSSHLLLFRCSAPPLICSYFDVQLRGGAEHRNKNKREEELNIEIKYKWEEELNIEIRTNERRSWTSSHLFLFRCSAPPLVCSYFVVQLLLSFVLISMFSSSSLLFLFRCWAPRGAEHLNKNKWD
jgi:hypothetical protein